MRPLHKALVATWVCCLAIGAAACGGGTDSQSGSTSGKVSGTLTFWMAGDSSNAPKWWDGLIKDFEAKYPAVHVRKTSFSKPDEINQKLLAAYAGGHPPDIFYSTGGNGVFEFSRRGLVEPLNGVVNLGIYRPDLLKAFFNDGGKTYGVPLYVAAPYVLWYNKALLAKVGVKPPTTWPELLSYCDTLNQKNIIPISLGNSGQWPVLMWFDNLVYQYGGGQIREDAIFHRNGVTWTAAPVQQALNRLGELVSRKCFPSNFNGVSYDQQESLFFNGQAASTALGDWIASDAKSMAPKGFDLDFVSLPSAPGATFRSGPGGGEEAAASGLSVTTRGGNKTAANAFLNFVGQRITDFTRVANRIAPTVTPPAPTDPVERRMFGNVEKAKGYYGVSDIILPATLWDDVYSNVQAFTLGKVNAQGFGAAMNKAVEREASELSK